MEPSGTYHVIARGNNRELICRDDVDRSDLVSMLSRAATRHRWVGLAYCLMSNHYHLVVRVPYGGLSQGVQELNGGFARRINRRHGRVGHLFQNRFFAVLIEHDAHLLEACRYVVLNPVRAGVCSTPEEWHWSSYRACAGDELAPAFLAVDELLVLFGTRREQARASYRAFVASEHGPVSDTVTAV